MMLLALLGAILFLTGAHFIRVMRWELFVGMYEKSDRKSLLQALSLGYFLNYFLPFKSGDVVRAWTSGRKMRNGKALGFSSVIVDRYLDIVSVGLIFMVITYVSGSAHDSNIASVARFYIIMAVLLLAIVFLFYALKSYVKKVTVMIARIFNARIEQHILSFVWALIWNFKNIFLQINKVKLILSTVLMWILYIFSYHLFAISQMQFGKNDTWMDVFSMLFAEKGLTSSTATVLLANEKHMAYETVSMFMYMFIPLILLWVISMIIPTIEYNNDEKESFSNLLPQLDAKERLDFLESYFSNVKREYILNYLKINQNVSVIRDFSAGSNATTMLCMDGEGFFLENMLSVQRAKNFVYRLNGLKNTGNFYHFPQ